MEKTKDFMVKVIIPNGIIFLMGYALFIVWNAILPQISNLPSLTYWQSFFLMLIIKHFFRGGS